MWVTPLTGTLRGMNRWRRASVLCVVVASLSACTGGPARDRSRYESADDRAVTASRDHVVTVGGVRDEATLEVASGVDTLTVTVSDLGDDLARVSTPAGSHVAPVIETDDPVRVVAAAGDGSGPAAMSVVLNPDAQWTLRLTGGAQAVTIDLRGGRVAEVDFVAGVSSIDLTLPAPDGTVPVRMGGGASLFAVHAPDGVPVRVTMTGGGGSATVDGASRSGIAGGTVIDAPGWDGATDRYDLDAVAGVSRLTLDRRA